MVKTSSENYSLDVLLESSEFFLFTQFVLLVFCYVFFYFFVWLVCYSLWVFLFKFCQKHKIEINFNILWKRKNNLFSNTVTEYILGIYQLHELETPAHISLNRSKTSITTLEQTHHMALQVFVVHYPNVQGAMKILSW